MDLGKGPAPKLVKSSQKVAELKILKEGWQIIEINHQGYRGVAFHNTRSTERPTGVVMVDPKTARELSMLFGRIAQQLEDKAMSLGTIRN